MGVGEDAEGREQRRGRCEGGLNALLVFPAACLATAHFCFPGGQPG